MDKLDQAIQKRGWSYTDASKETGLSEQSIRNLVRVGHTRETNPAQMHVYSCVRLLEVFPELDLPDFVNATTLRVARKRRRAK